LLTRDNWNGYNNDLEELKESVKEDVGSSTAYLIFMGSNIEVRANGVICPDRLNSEIMVRNRPIYSFMHHIPDGVTNLVRWIDMPFVGLSGKNDRAAGRGLRTGFLQGPTPSLFKRSLTVVSDSEDAFLAFHSFNIPLVAAKH